MTEVIHHGGKYITENGDEIDTSNLSTQGKAQLANLHFVNAQITQKNNELQIADSARIVYSHVLKAELDKINTEGSV